MKNIGMTDIQRIETHMISVMDKICKDNNIKYYLHAGSLLGAIRHNGPIPWDSDGDIEVPIDQYKHFYETLKKSLPKHLKVYWHEDQKYPLLFMRIGINNYNHEKIHIDVYPMIGLNKNKKANRRMLRELLILQYIYLIKSFSFVQVLQRRKKLIPILLVLKILFLLIPSRLIEKYTEKKLFKYNFSESPLVVNPFTIYGENAIINKEYYEPAIYWDYENLKLPIPNNYKEILKQFYGNYMEFPSQNKIDKAMNINISIPDDIYNTIISSL